jgi:hypothetical protein
MIQRFPEETWPLTVKELPNFACESAAVFFFGELLTFRGSSCLAAKPSSFEEPRGLYRGAALKRKTSTGS